MALHGVKKSGTIDYILNSEKDNADPTVFAIRSLSISERIKVIDIIQAADATSQTAQMLSMLEVAALGVEEIRNVIIEGKAQNIRIGSVEDLDILPIEVLLEVAGAVVERNSLSREESKN